MKKYTANYSHSNHNFVIQNLTGQRIKNKYLPAICILRNILQRGKPTLLSKCLQSEIGSIHKSCDFKKSYPLIDTECPKWERIIRGDVKGNYFPALKFFEELIPRHLPDYRFIQQLIIPEVLINEITQVEVDEFARQQVDFYLPQAYLIIEIDGCQHKEQLAKDEKRDLHTEKYAIQTIRIKTSDLEAENAEFLSKVAEIKKRINEAILSQEKRRENDPTFISIQDYKEAFENGTDLSNPNYRATAIIRFQLLVLELLATGGLDFSKEWNFEILIREGEKGLSDFAALAIEDLNCWFEHLFRLQKVEFERREYTLTDVNSIEKFTSSPDSIRVDFSLLKRYTDEFQTNENLIFVRTDYLDEYRYFKMGDANDGLTFSSIEPYDYFQIATTDLINYKLRFGGEDSDEAPLRFMLENIFLQEIPKLTFNEGQLPIIANALAHNHTIGLLPTGSGKSVCYQLAAILQPAISFVVCPIKSLMYDQKADLDSADFTRTNHITSDDDGPAKEKIQEEFSKGKYFFIFISPERFQVKEFRKYFSSVNEKFSIAYAVIDEVHCLSEWGHDFRTSYLNLAKTIRRLCRGFRFIGLTATASLNVLKDIQIELGIQPENVKTFLDYTRKELDFEVIDDGGNKQQKLVDILEHLDHEIGIFEANGGDSKCGIIFTRTVNDSNSSKGCYRLSLELSRNFRTDVRYYSGAVPKVKKKPIITDTEFNEYKKQIQNEFKSNKFTLLTATKAFGMGVNKPNIHFTVHYGIPGSMESLYQEGGRAGRDKQKFSEEKKAKCVVLLSRAGAPKDKVDQLWQRETHLSKLKKLQKGIKGDLDTNLFLFSLGLDVIGDEFQIIKQLHKKYSSRNKKSVHVTGGAVIVQGKKANKSQTEKAIYRLSQLGIIEDWTIKDWAVGGGGGVFEVDYANYTLESIKESLLNTIRKYEPDFAFVDDGLDFDKCVLLLLQWVYDHFAYNRRQSLKNIYESCCEFSDGMLTKEDFKTRLEDYFKFNERSLVLQHIAEKPKDYKRWFEVFYQTQEDGAATDEFLTEQQQQGLEANLSRFLESYRYNTGLDLISGLVRLLLDDYKNVDGRERLESSLEKIQGYESNAIEFIKTQILRVGKELSDKNRRLLAVSLYKYFTDDSFVYRMQRELGDSYSMMLLIEIIKKANKRVKIINQRINGKLYGELRKAG
jgi:ATP-dependent DNA helicase RecQ